MCVCVWGGGGVRWGGRRGRAETLARFSFDTHCVSGSVNIFLLKHPVVWGSNIGIGLLFCFNNWLAFIMQLQPRQLLLGY